MIFANHFETAPFHLNRIFQLWWSQMWITQIWENHVWKIPHN